MGEPSGDRSRPPLLAMLEARSVAVVGASARPGSFGETMMLELGRGAFDGRVHPVNPRYEDVLGRRCHPSLANLPEAADHVMLGVPNDRLEEQLRAAADAGARSATIFASGYEPAEPGVPTLIERLTDVARQAGMAICGGNCMGYFNLDRGLRVTGFAQPEGLRPGPVTFISHSGSAFAAMLHNDRGVRFNLVVSAGQEFVTTSAEYLDYALDQPTTKVAALFVEAVRQPDAFRAALAKAAERDIPVVILKVGRTERTKELIAAHS
ncbi:MAG TPA: CoA-binding protein, partial [Actinomycetota bacterium]|nr:CoA-binding protein [Actinomycetota bacterium]